MTERTYSEPLTCSRCRVQFEREQTAESRLLEAILPGGPTVCPACSLIQAECTKCSTGIEHPIYFEDKPYHPECLPNA